MSCKAFHISAVWLAAWFLRDVTTWTWTWSWSCFPVRSSMLSCPVLSVFADHCVHYYDLRNTKQPIMVFKGHRKAVSYAKFVSGEEIVSA